MLTKGTFVTPRNVIKNMTTKKCPYAEDIIKQMKELEEIEVGYVKKIPRAQTAFYKPLPVEENKEKIVEVIGSDHWDIYVQNFKEVNTVYITISQHNRLLEAAENEDELESFGMSPQSES